MKSLYLIPMPLAEDPPYDEISLKVKNALGEMDVFVAERARTFRRFVKHLNPDIQISNLEIIEISKNNNRQSEIELIDLLQSHNLVGMVSEAGCPGIADPGNFLVQYAHLHNIEVIPLSGPSSIFMALMASGFNGQQFTFHGYLPRQEQALIHSIQRLEREMIHTGYTQIFMETPYRNDKLMESLLKQLSPETLLHLSCNLTSDAAFISTYKVIQWKKKKPLHIHKKPCIFAIGRYW